MLHPFMPFITEEIWGSLPGSEGFLMAADWPVYREDRDYPAETAVLETAMAAVRAIRTIRVEAEAPPSRKLSALVLAEGDAARALEAGERYLCKLANLTAVTFIKDKAELPEDVMSAVIDGGELFIPGEELLDYHAEAARLTKEKGKLQAEIDRIRMKLDNPGFVARYPACITSATARSAGDSGR